MKIGVVGPIWLNIPPVHGYGGTEEVVYNLVEGLKEKGHEVTLFGPKNSKVSCKVFPTVERPLRDDGIAWDSIPETKHHLSTAFSHASEFDILHVQVNKEQDYLALPMGAASLTPAIFTLHFLLPSTTFYPKRYKILKKYAKLPYTSISDSQRKIPELNYVATVYNGIDIKNFPFQAQPDDYFVWLGKIKREKGTKEAILIAKKAQVKLKLMGPVENGVPETKMYFEKEIKPLIDGKQIVWIGEVGHAEKTEILGKAKAFLNPIQWDEPFGLVMTESQAVGTPVISIRRGSAPELIQDGKTGFLADNLDEMVEVVGKVDSLSRKACRENIERNFTKETMVSGYFEAYKKVISNWDVYRKQQLKM